MRSAIVLVSAVLALCSCAELSSLMGGSTIYYLSPEPRSSGCSDSDCQQLDRYEAQLYNSARSGRITRTQLVNMFYARRNQLFPDSEENDFTREIRAYQRVLAEQMDRKQLTEAQWIYLLDKRAGELNARNAQIQNSQPRTTNCKTTNTGTSINPVYSTQCY